MTLVAATLAMLLVIRPGPGFVERTAQIPADRRTLTPRGSRSQKSSLHEEYGPLHGPILAEPRTTGFLPDTAHLRHFDQPMSYLEMRQLVLTYGVDALPMTSFPGGSGESKRPETLLEWRRHILREAQRGEATRDFDFILGGSS